MNPDQIFRGLLSRGLPEHIAAGFMDNFAAESGFDPSINERNPVVPGSRGGRGLYQLTGPRRKSYESQYGTNYDVDSQLDFLMSELSGPESKAWAAISATPDRAEATRAISRAFLRPGHDNSAERVGMWGGGGTDKLAGGLSIQPGKGEDRLMEQPAEQKKGLLGGIFGGNMDPEKRAQIGLALSGLAYRPNRGMQAALQMQAQSARDDKTMNKSLAWLRSMGRDDLVQAVASDAIDVRTAAQIAYKESRGGSGTEYGLTPQYVTDKDGNLKMVQLGKNGEAKEVDLPEGMAVAKGMEKLDLGTHYQWVNKFTGEPVGEPFSKNNAQAAGEIEAGKQAIDLAGEAWGTSGKMFNSVSTIDEAITAIDGGAKAGAVYKYLPNVTEQSASLSNAMDRMGLDVVSATTFGALSEGELRLAMQTAVPRDLEPAALRNWLVKKREATQKAALMLQDAAAFLSKPGNTLDMWISQNRRTATQPPMSPAVNSPISADEYESLSDAELLERLRSQ